MNVVSAILPPLIVLSFNDVSDTALDLVKVPERVFGFLTRQLWQNHFLQ